MTLFQISAILFALFMAYVIRVHQSRAKLSKVESGLWYSLWFLFAVIAALPNLLIGISNYFYFDRVFDMLVVGAFMVLSFIVIRTYLFQKEIQKKFEDVISTMALKKLIKKTQKK